MKYVLLLTIKLGATGAILFMALGFLGQLHPVFDTLSHFRLHVSAGLLVLFLLFVGTGNRTFAIACITAGILGFWTAQTALPITAEKLPPIDDKPVHTLVHINLFWNNEKKDSLIGRIKNIDPLLISLTETSAQWLPFIDRLDERWPYRAHCAESGVLGGVMVFSKLQMNSSDDFCGDNGSFMKTSVTFSDGTYVDIASVHPRWPWPASGPIQYASFEKTLKTLNENALIAGDFNATPWSHAVQNFAQSGGLSIVSGIGSTWFFGEFPASVIRVLGLPIDHVMHKGQIRILSAKTLESWGSDHLPLLVRFQIN